VNDARTAFWPPLAAAVALHAAVLAWLWVRPPAPRALPPRRPTTVKLVTRPPPPAPAPAPAAEPARPAAPPPLAATRPASAAPPRPAPAAPAEPAPPPPPGPPPQPRRFAVSMDAVVPGGAGGVAVPVTAGATAARGNPNAPASAPVGDNTAFATRGPAPGPVDAVDVEVAPRLLRGPSAEALRARYPEAARQARLEADVRLELVVDEAGRVTQARVLAPAGNGFDEAAAELARQLAFAPATRGGRPLAVRTPWTFKFRLDE
jgi:TonB family protein